MNPITKESLKNYQDKDVEVYIGFSDLDESEYEAEKERFIFPTNQKVTKEKESKKILKNKRKAPSNKKKEEEEITKEKSIQKSKPKQKSIKNLKPIPEEEDINEPVVKNEIIDKFMKEEKFNKKEESKEEIDPKEIPKKQFSDILLDFFGKYGIKLKADDTYYIKTNNEKLEKLFNFVEQNKGIENVILYSLFSELDPGNEPSLKKDYDNYLNQYSTYTHIKEKKNHIISKEICKKYSTLISLVKTFNSFENDNKKVNLSCFLIKLNSSKEIFKENEIKILMSTNQMKQYKYPDNDQASSLDMDIDPETTPSNVPSPEYKIFIINISNYPNIYNVFKKLIPENIRPKSEIDVLKYSSIDINGITTPRMIYAPNEAELTNCYDSPYVQFRRYVVNFGPGEIVNIVVDGEYKKDLKFVSEKITSDFLTKKNIPFHYYIQKPNDVSIIEAGNMHFCNVVNGNCIIINWCQMGWNLREISKAIEFQKSLVADEQFSKRPKIPIYTTLLKGINQRLSVIGLDIIKFCSKEILGYLSQNDNIKNATSFLVKENIGLIKQPKKYNVNFCSECNKEILNYYTISKINSYYTLCLGCFVKFYQERGSEFNRVLIYKFEESDSNLFFERIKQRQKAKEAEVKSKVSYEKPQKVFENIYGNEVSKYITTQIKNCDPMIFDSVSCVEKGNDLDIISSCFIPLVSGEEAEKGIQEENANPNPYTEIQNIGINEDEDNFGRFSPLLQRRFSEDTYEFTNDMQTNPIGKLLLNSGKEKVEEIKTNKSSNKANVINDTGLYNHLKGGSLFDLIDSNSTSEAKNKNSKNNDKGPKEEYIFK